MGDGSRSYLRMTLDSIGSTDVELPQHVQPSWPGACVRCGELTQRRSSLRLFSPASWYTKVTWANFKRSILGTPLEFPACQRCAPLILTARWLDWALALVLIFGAMEAARAWGLVGADPPDWQIWGVGIAAIVPLAVARALWPRPLDVTFKKSVTVYEFKNSAVAQAFAQTNHTHVSD